MSIENIRKIKEEALLPKTKKVYKIPKKSAKKIAQERLGVKIEIVDTTRKPTNTGEMQRWFEDRRKEMTGICANCGGKTCKKDDKYYKFSIAHILPKAYFKSIATEPNNWIELCHFGNSCHSQYDNHMIDLIDLNCFDSVIEKFVKLYPSIAKEEKRRIPGVLLEYLKNET